MPGYTFSTADRLLLNEAALSASSIGFGLNSLRNYDHIRIGYLYHAFLSLSIGLERLMKIILIQNAKGLKGNLPSDKELRNNYGHDLNKLIIEALKINDQNNFNIDCSFYTDAICINIINNLNDFANNHGRYYNIGFSTNNHQNIKEPIERWDTEVNNLILKKHYKRDIKKEQFIELFHQNFSDDVSISFHTEQGKHINNLRDLYTNGLTLETKRKYSMYYTFRISRFLASLIQDIEYKYGIFPLCSEIFMLLRNADDKYILNRKTWDPYRM